MSTPTRNAGREMLPAEPLQAAIRRDAKIGDGLWPLGERISIHGDILSRILSQQHVSLDLADRYCCATGRLLSEMYPSLYEERVETVTWRCKRCRIEVDMDLLSESPRRMYLRCRDCGRGHHVERFKRGAPRNSFPAHPVATETIVAEYLAGATGLELARKYGFSSEDGIYNRLRRAGVPRRPRATPQGIAAGVQNLAAYREQHSRESLERAETIAEMWNAGLPGKAIAAHFGVNVATVKEWRKRFGLRRRLPGGRGWA